MRRQLIQAGCLHVNLELGCLHWKKKGRALHSSPSIFWETNHPWLKFHRFQKLYSLLGNVISWLCSYVHHFFIPSNRSQLRRALLISNSPQHSASQSIGPTTNKNTDKMCTSTIFSRKCAPPPPFLATGCVLYGSLCGCQTHWF